MRKFLFFAAALLGLVACSKNDLTAPIEPGQPCTLTGTIELPQGQNAVSRKVYPELDKIANDILSFQWQMYDVLMVSVDKQKKPFVVTSISNNGVATLHGDFAGSLDNYAISYGNQDSAVVTYTANSFDPMVKGEGVEKTFRLDSYNPVLKLSLKAAESPMDIYCIRYYVNSELKTTLYCGNSLKLGTDSTLVYFPVIGEAEAGNAEVEFCSTDKPLMRKSWNMEVENSTLYNMPTLMVADESPERIADIEDETTLKRKAAKPQREYSLDGGETWKELTKDTNLKPEGGINPLICITINGERYEISMPLTTVEAKINSEVDKTAGTW